MFLKLNIRHWLIILILLLFGINMSYFCSKKKESNVAKDVKIIATLGKNGWLKVNDFCKNGADILRINGSHIKSSDDLIETLSSVNRSLKISNCDNIDVMYDTQGPEIRTRIVNNSKSESKNLAYKIKENDVIVVHTDLKSNAIIFNRYTTKQKNGVRTINIGVNYENFVNDVNVDSEITIENREVYAKVISVDKQNGIVELRITKINNENNEYLLTDRRHINLLGAPVSQDTLTENDKQYIKISALLGVKYYAISFARDANDIKEARNLISSAFMEDNPSITETQLDEKMKQIKIIAKIETRQGLDNIEQIVKEADGAMVARGDLSSEIPVEEVPYAKETIIETCNKYNKFSILATNVLESLLSKKSASMNDIDVIATALKLGVSSLMLSNETAASDAGVDAIKEMKKHIKYFINK